MKKKTKETDLICSNCGNVYPIKYNRQITKIKGFKYAYCFRCMKMTRHQEIISLDLYKKELESKNEEEYTKKDKILSKVIK